jgi:dihydrofolate reductase
VVGAGIGRTFATPARHDKEAIMRKLVVFNQVSLDGFFTDANSDIGWAHKHDPEWNAFLAENAESEGTLLFGRVTYEMMVAYWPTPLAAKNDPAVAKQMNLKPKVVFSRTLKAASWNNTRLLKGDLATEIGMLKSETGADMVILGSGSIVAELAPTGLIDEYQLIVNPIVIGEGRTLFEGVREKLSLRRTGARTFSNGNVLVSYVPSM